MKRLLSANFTRLWKSKVFWLGMAVMSGLGLIVAWSTYREHLEYSQLGQASPDDIVFAGNMYISIVIAVFIGIFIGTEYGDGTIRNKLIAGHSRLSIYLSNLVVCMAAAFLMQAAGVAAVAAAGTLLLGEFQIGTNVLIAVFASSLVSITALTAIYLLISMLVQSKATGSVAAVIVSMLLLFWTFLIVQRLSEPEYYEAYILIDGEGEQIEVEAERNPQYLTGTKREVYEFLYDFLPACQLIQTAGVEMEGLEGSPDQMLQLAFYSFTIAAASTACGCLAFRKKDLR